MLAEYNRDPWDVDKAKITLQGLFDLWKEKGTQVGKIESSVFVFGVQALFKAAEHTL